MVEIFSDTTLKHVRSKFMPFFFSSITLYKPQFIDLQIVSSSNIRCRWDIESCNRCNQRLAKHVIPKCDPHDYKKATFFVIFFIFFGFKKSKSNLSHRSKGLPVNHYKSKLQKQKSYFSFYSSQNKSSYVYLD